MKRLAHFFPDFDLLALAGQHESWQEMGLITEEDPYGFKAVDAATAIEEWVDLENKRHIQDLIRYIAMWQHATGGGPDDALVSPRDQNKLFCPLFLWEDEQTVFLHLTKQTFLPVLWTTLFFLTVYLTNYLFLSHYPEQSVFFLEKRPSPSSTYYLVCPFGKTLLESAGCRGTSFSSRGPHLSIYRVHMTTASFNLIITVDM